MHSLSTQDATKERTRRELKIERKVSLAQVLFSLGLAVFVLVAMVAYVYRGLVVRANELQVAFESGQGLEQELARDTLPQLGEFITVSEAESFWRFRQSHFSGLDSGGGLKTSILMFPQVRLSLQRKPDAPEGVLRLVLFDSFGGIHSDPQFFDLKEGLVVDGTELVDEVRFEGTEGLKDETIIVLHKLHPDTRWYLGVFEGAHRWAGSEEFSLVAKIYIEPQVID